eukprot:IDg3866t1
MTMERCPVTVSWAASTKSKLKRSNMGNACFLGMHVSGILKEPESTMPFFPNMEFLHSNVFVPVILEAAKYAGLKLNTKHVINFYNINANLIEKEIQFRFEKSRVLRLQELLVAFTKYTGFGRHTNVSFASSDTINDGLYRRTNSSLVDEPMFVRAVKETFRVKKVKHYQNEERNAFTMIAALARDLFNMASNNSEQSSVHLTENRWKTPSFEIVANENARRVISQYTK